MHISVKINKPKHHFFFNKVNKYNYMYTKCLKSMYFNQIIHNTYLNYIHCIFYNNCNTIITGFNRKKSLFII